MSGRRQKNRPEQEVLAFAAESRSDAPRAAEQGTETLMAKRKSESLAGTERLMEEVCERENCKQALQRVKANKGSPGVEGRTVDELSEYLKQHGLKIGEQLRSGTYQPQPVRRVEIPKPEGSGMRKLGIPCVLDRFVQQVVLQVLQKRWDPTFSEHSHGFRPGRSAKQAVHKAQQYIAEGYRWVVDLDLEKFFDRVNHDRLFAAVAERVADKRMLKLMRAFLKAGVMEDGLVSAVDEIRLELLANPDDWTATLTHQANEVVDRLKKASKAITSASGLVTKYRDRIQSLCDTAAPKKLSTPQPHEAEIAQAGD